jgi:AcrR family transcriptional regulator
MYVMFGGGSQMQRRERKKQVTRGRIVEAARRLFAEQGYQSTTIEQVADAADVGVGTLYNYFGAKERLLLGVFADATARVLDQGRAAITEPPADPIEAIVGLLGVYEQLGTLFERSVMREMFAASLVQSTVEVREFASLDEQLAAQVGELIVKLQMRGDIASDVDVASAAIALYGALLWPLLMFLSMPAMDEAALSQMIRGQVLTVFRGLASRPGRGGSDDG